MKIIGAILRFLFPWVEKTTNQKYPIMVTKFVNANGALTDAVIEYSAKDRVVISYTPNDVKEDKGYLSLKELFGYRMERDFHAQKNSASKVISYLRS